MLFTTANGDNEYMIKINYIKSYPEYQNKFVDTYQELQKECSGRLANIVQMRPAGYVHLKQKLYLNQLICISISSVFRMGYLEFIVLYQGGVLLLIWIGYSFKIRLKFEQISVSCTPMEKEPKYATDLYQAVDTY